MELKTHKHPINKNIFLIKFTKKKKQQKKRTLQVSAKYNLYLPLINGHNLNQFYLCDVRSTIN